MVLWRLPSPRHAATGEARDAGTAGETPVAQGDVAATPAPAAAATPVTALFQRDRERLRTVVVPVLGLALIDLVGSVAGGGLGVLTVILAVSPGSGRRGDRAS